MLKRKWIVCMVLALVLGLMFCSTAYATPQKDNQNQQQDQQISNDNNGNDLSMASRYMINKGIIKGIANGNFNMFHSVRRCDMMIMLMRAFGLEYNGNCSFGDVPSGKYYFNAVKTALGLGIAKGDGQNFHPESSMTLQEAITFVERTIDKLNIDSDLDLYAIFEDRDLSDYATREDIAVMLYAVIAENLGASNLFSKNVICYETDEETAITFDEDDFNDVCEKVTGDSLDYVAFTLPSNGTLYYDYEGSDEDTISASDEYYYDDTPSVSDVTFVPDDDFAGVVKFSYTAYNDEDESFTGTVKVIVGDENEEVEAQDINYETDEEEAINFDEDDFNDVCLDAAKDTLDYVEFTLPWNGTLYYDYEGSDEDTVIASDEYYYDDTPSISDVTFVPDDNFTGTVKIYYTGYDDEGESFSGIIEIEVEED